MADSIMPKAPLPELDFLVAVRATLSDPAHWTKGAWARNRADSWVPAHSEHAVCWCLGGAGAKVALSSTWDTNHYYEDWLKKLIPPEFTPLVPGNEIVMFNDADHVDHKAILAILDSGIKALNPDYVPPETKSEE